MLTTGIMLLMFGFWSLHLYHRFTPVYSEITCHMDQPQLTDLQLIPLSFTLRSTTTCENPNPYSLDMVSTGEGTVYMGSPGNRRTEVGMLQEVPKTTLPANGRGSITAYVNIVPTAKLVGSAWAILLGQVQEIPIFLESRMRVEVDIKFLVGSFKTTKPLDKDCGFNMAVPSIINPSLRWGPLACGERFDGLDLPPVSGDAAPDELILKGTNLAASDLEEATHLKDVSLGACMGVGFLLGLVLVTCGAVGIGIQFCRCQKQARELNMFDTTTTNSLPATQIGAQANPRSRVILLGRTSGGNVALAPDDGKVLQQPMPQQKEEV